MQRSFIVGLLWMLSLSATTGLCEDQTSSQHERPVVHKVVPVYPDLAVRTHLSGIVKLEATIAPNGSVKVIKVVGGNPVLIKAAQAAVQNWKYATAPDETRESVELVFRAPN